MKTTKCSHYPERSISDNPFNITTRSWLVDRVNAKATRKLKRSPRKRRRKMQRYFPASESGKEIIPLFGDAFIEGINCDSGVWSAMV